MPSSSDERGPVDLLADEFLARHKRGEKPTIKEYCDRHPELADDIRDVFEALLMVEDLRPGSADVSGSFGDPVQVDGKRLERVGDYQILREVGRGGMGVVYEAQQLSLGRHVALKVLPSHALLDPSHLGRFQREARAAARLHHTNIVPVYGVGEQDGLPYYVMQFIPGLGLDAVLVELQRLRQPRGQPAIVQKNEPGRPTNRTGVVSAVEVAQALLTGEFRPADPASPPAAGPGEAKPVASAPGNVGASTPVPRADSSATIHMPGQPEGSTLTESGRQYWQSVARIGMQVAGALAHAATQGILHRDIKPSNLLLDDTGNVWVTDFGLAKADTDVDNLTHTGDIIGTLRYMAPERFNGQGDVRSDVYSLGLTLYELLTLRPAFDESDRNQLVKQVMHDEPVRPCKLNRSVPPDLEIVILKAIARDPAHRYQTPAELAEDLKRFVEDRPIRARRISNAEKFWRWCRRNPLPASLLAGIVLVFLMGFVGVFSQWRQAEAARENEQGQRKDAELARDYAKAQEAKALAEKERAEREEAKAKAAEERTAAALYGSNIVRAQLQYRANNVADAEDILDRCPVERQGWEWHFLKHLCHADLLTLKGHTSWVYAVAYSPDGNLLATAGGGNPYWETQGAGSIQPGEVILWDAATGARLRTLQGHKNLITCVAFSPDGKILASGSQDDTVRLWDPASGKTLRVLPGRSPPGVYKGYGVSSVAFSPDGKLLAVGLPGGKIDVWDLTPLPDAPPVRGSTLSGPVGHWATGVTFSPDGRRLAAAYRTDWKGEVKFWDLAGGVEAVTLEANTGVVNGVALSSDGRYLAAWHHGRSVKVWDAATGKLLQTLGGQGSDFFAGAFSPTGDRFAAGSTDGVVRIWSVPAGQEVHLFRGHRGAVRGIAFSADGPRLASGSIDGTVKFWDLTQDPEHGLVNYGRDQIDIEAVAFADQGRHLVAAQRGGPVQSLDGDSWRPLSTVALTGRWLTPAEPACLDAEGRWLTGISGEDPRVAKCWEAATGQERATLRGHQQALSFVTINLGGTRVATAGRSNRGEPLHSEVKVWDAAKGQPLFELDEPNLQVTRLALSPDGDRVALAGLRLTPGAERQQPEVNPVVRVYHALSKKVLREFVVPAAVAGKYQPLLALAFNATGTRLAAADFGRTVLLWDLSAEQPAVTHQGPEEAMDLTFSPDGRRLAIASRRQIKLLDAASGEEVLTLLGRRHLSPDKNGFNPRVRFSPDGQRLVAVCHDQVFPIALWSVEKEADRNPAARLRAADRRVIATHFAFANAYAGDPKKQVEFAYHLKQLQGREFTSAKEYAARGILHESAGQLDEAKADFARVAQLTPEKAAALNETGLLYVAFGQWDQAAPYFDKYFTIGQGNHFSFCVIAALPLYRNDLPAYRRNCKLLLERYGQSKDPQILLDILYWGLLVSEEGGPPQELLRLADQIVDGNESHLTYQWMVMTKGMADYRAGRFDSAVKWLLKAKPLVWNQAGTQFYLSMAYHRLNQPDNAKTAYQEAMRQLTAYFGTADRFTPGKGEWFYWPWYQVLRREAEAVLSNAKRPVQPKD